MSIGCHEEPRTGYQDLERRIQVGAASTSRTMQLMAARRSSLRRARANHSARSVLTLCCAVIRPDGCLLCLRPPWEQAMQVAIDPTLAITRPCGSADHVANAGLRTMTGILLTQETDDLPMFRA